MTGSFVLFIYGPAQLHLYAGTMFRFVASFILLLFAAATSPVSGADYLSEICSTKSNYTSNSSYQQSLKLLLASLERNASNVSFYSAASGQVRDQAYGLFLCRGDINGDSCRDCVSVAATQIIRRCPNSKTAIIWFDYCQLRYSDVNFLGTLDTTEKVHISANDSDALTATAFNEQLGYLLNNLSSAATSDGIMFATGVIPYFTMQFADLRRIYGMVQCTGDITTESCSKCLKTAISDLSRCCKGKQSARILTGSCIMRYEVYPFLYSNESGVIQEGDRRPISANCSAASDYTANSTYQQNVGHLLLNLAGNSSYTDFHSATYGEGLDQAHGLFLCRGDISGEACRNCTLDASAKIRQLCPNSKEAIIWFFNCHVRYSNINFFGQVDTNDKAYLWNVQDVVQPDLFNRQLQSLMANLTSNATIARSGRMFATGVVPFHELNNIYGLVQCTRDITLDGCLGCLKNAISDIPYCCGGKQGGRVLSGSCNLRYELYNFVLPSLPASPVHPPTISLPPSSAPNSKSRRSRRKVLVILVAILVPSSLIAFLLWFLFLRKTKKGDEGPDGAENDSKDSPLFSFDSIKAATNNFSEANKLGENDFSCVYKAFNMEDPKGCAGGVGYGCRIGSHGLIPLAHHCLHKPTLRFSAPDSKADLQDLGKLPNDNEIAAKRLKIVFGQGTAQFRNELQLLAKLAHRNLVRLLGYCIDGGESILVYEYMPNGSLKDHIFDPAKNVQISWAARTKLILGIARGLLYLHEESRLKIIHRDLKASNILLDKDMKPKISDFGVARLIELEQSGGNTSRIAGTYGYVAPECLLQGQFSTRSDIFSFGVLLLEILSGRYNAAFDESRGVEDLVGYAWRLWRANEAMELIDQTVRESCEEFLALRYIHVGLLCVQGNAADRPTIGSVVTMISNKSVALPMPSAPPSFTKIELEAAIRVPSGAEEV